ncbi:hypothetical protein ES703_74762 [subsurface metagenome]
MKRPSAKPAKESYRRKLPHLQREGKSLFVTFSTFKRWILPESVRHLVINDYTEDHKKFTLPLNPLPPGEGNCCFQLKRKVLLPLDGGGSGWG